MLKLLKLLLFYLPLAMSYGHKKAVHALLHREGERWEFKRLRHVQGGWESVHGITCAKCDYTKEQRLFWIDILNNENEALAKAKECGPGCLGG